MENRINLNYYFQRIGYTGPVDATLRTLQEIHWLHPQAIPFENLNPLLGLPVALDLEALEQKLLLSKRGGFCFEQNTLLSHVLRALGFKVRGLAGRVLWNLPEDVTIARAHMLLLVEIGEIPYIVDVGFGGVTLTSPLELKTDTTQETSLEWFRFIKADDEYILQVELRGSWQPIYRFGLQEQLLLDYEVSNWYLCHHPNSKFVSSLIVARTAPDRRYTLRHNQFAIHHINGETEKRIVSNTSELREILAETFNIEVPETPDAEQRFQRLFE